MSADNRRYEYQPGVPARRREYETIVAWVERGSRVLDLGCGDGSLLARLIDEKNANAEGMEASPSGVAICRQKGMQVQEGSIDRGELPWPDQSFDFVVCNVTIQMVLYPEKLLGEMVRIGRRQILSFPNFGNLRNRWQLLVHGQMPRAMLFGHDWWNTGHVHQLSVRDFREFLGKFPVKIVREKHLGAMAQLGLCRLSPNLFSTIALFELEGKST